ncbi:molecular chaperone IbpA [Nitrospirillum amazonense]|uniref:Molecular chaperone IbpA n=1 Tax=Nitrospirillum amazonense TaxID=28077 RepID=A0A560JLJ8_9PROT|nr:Hsp20 family protein [Nitrospirillum amazonense]TWB71837.1 molecular chaperone IbpA [Nitrospirillum amazonense]
MSAFDFSPLFRSGVGFDRLASVLEQLSTTTPADSYPPYDILKTGENAYRIVVALAGWSADELALTAHPNLLIVQGRKAAEEKAQYLHHGLSARSFERRFELADFVFVDRASLENGLLTIDLKRELPEAMKPRRIEILSGGANPRLEEHQAGEKQAA